MELTLEECQTLINALNVQAKAGFEDGLIGSQKAFIMVMKLQNHATELTNAAKPKSNGEAIPEAELVK